MTDIILFYICCFYWTLDNYLLNFLLGNLSGIVFILEFESLCCFLRHRFYFYLGHLLFVLLQ